MAVESATFPDEWLIDELPRLYQERPHLVHPLLRSLLDENEELRWSLAVRAYQDAALTWARRLSFWASTN